MAVIAYREALNQAMSEEMEPRRSPRLPRRRSRQSTTPPYKVSQGMLAKFDARRIIDTPISRKVSPSMGIGAAVVGLLDQSSSRYFGFSLGAAVDQIVNNAANMRYMSGGQFSVPIVFRGCSRHGRLPGRHHSTGSRPGTPTSPA